MKITGFRPLIVSKDADAAAKLFEELGFERIHTKEGIEGKDISTSAFRDASGNNLNIASADTLPQDITAIAINVDNFQEAYDFFIAHGFVNPRGDAVTDTSSSRATLLYSPSGYAVNIAEHIK